MYSGFFCEIFSASLIHLGILWDKNHIKIFCLEIWVKMIFGWPAFKIICNTPIFYQLSMSNWKQVSDYRLLGASSLFCRLLIKHHHPLPTKCIFYKCVLGFIHKYFKTENLHQSIIYYALKESFKKKLWPFEIIPTIIL